MSDDPNDSDWVHEWTDEGYKERYRLHAREVYEDAKALRDFSFKSNVEYGKWLLASGLAVHGGAIFALNTLATNGQAARINGILDSVAFHAAGIFFVLIAGFAAWLNFQYAATLYSRLANPSMMYRKDTWLDLGSEKRDPVGATRFLAMMAGLLSLWCLVASAVNIVQVLHAG
ncbi:hypothetical protein [Ciceribacter thiooxidans]|uniref:Uncharacterized protein n=1 Tax=Ciceribacter thiooxidans TaxID=1969821 RepID=A0ABV7IAM1_9HYPH|nr:hypothetical protein [Ciceribacter thiooxidans]